MSDQDFILNNPETGSMKPMSSSAPEQDGNDQTIGKLRDLLFHEDLARIDALEARLKDLQISPETVAKVLAEAVQQSASKDDALSQALSSPVEESVKASVARNPQALSDALFPVMGPAIRKSINSAIESMLQSLNQTLEYGFSMQGLKWRLDAFRTKKTFAEIVLLNTLVYRVEQVFLIHKQTGVLLNHQSFNHNNDQDADVISGMLTAVQDFMRDSFSGESDQNVETLRLGSLEIIIKQSPDLVLAIVNRGNAPRSLHEDAEEALEKLQKTLYTDLKSFHGNTSHFETANPVLNQLMLSDYGNAGKKSSLLKPFLAISLVAISIMAWLGYAIYQEQAEQARWAALIHDLNAQPGIVIADHQMNDDGVHTLSGLRDPLSIEPSSLLTQHKIERSQVAFQLQAFHSGQEAFILQRVKRIIQPPESINLSLSDSTLFIQGTASPKWVEQAQYRAIFVDGVEAVDLSALNSLYERVKAALQPPETVIFTLTPENEVHVSGLATQIWASKAATNILRVNDVTFYIDDALIIADSPAYLLQQAKALLTPPASVVLSVSDEKILFAQGTATAEWIENAKTQHHNIPYLLGYNDSQLSQPVQVVEIDNDAEILRRAIAYLTPPKTTTLSFAKGRLVAVGNASQRWIKSALRDATKVDGIKYYDSNVKPLTDEQILAAAITLLQPPATVELSYSQGILSAKGRATPDWINRAERDFVGVDDIHSFYTTNLSNP